MSDRESLLLRFEVCMTGFALVVSAFERFVEGDASGELLGLSFVDLRFLVGVEGLSGL